MNQTLPLNLHREFFDAIAAKTKKNEYRQCTAHWRRRFQGRHYDLIQFRNGYATQAPEMLAEAGQRIDTSPNPLPVRSGEGCGQGRDGCYAVRLGEKFKN